MAEQTKTPEEKATAKQAAEKQAAEKKKAAPEPQAKKPPPKKVNIYEPFNVVSEFTNNKQLCGAKFSPCGNYVIAGGTTGGIHRWNAAEEFAPLADFTGHGGWVQPLAFSPTGTQLYSADSWGKLCAWDYTAAESKPLWSVDEAHGAWIRGVAVSSDGKLLATASRDGFVRLWDAATGKKMADLEGHNTDVYSVVFSPDDKTLVSGDFMGTIKFWDVATKKPTRDLDAKIFSALERLQDVGGVRILKFTDEGKTLVAAGTQPTNGGTVQGYPTIAIYDVASGKQSKVFKFGEVKDGLVYDVVMHQAGYWIVVTSGVTGSGKLLLLRPADEKPFAETTRLANLHGVSLHPDGKRIIVTACNPNNSGNGVVKVKGSTEYASNWSPVKLVELPSAEPTT